MALLDKLMGRNEREVQLQNEIKSLQLRKQSVVTALSNEQAQLQRERMSVLLEAGEKGFANWCANLDENTGLESFWKKVQELDKEIAEKEEKKTSMVARYDEEIQLIQSDLNVVSPATRATVAAASGKCPKCGKPVASNDVFCESCGAKL